MATKWIQYDRPNKFFIISFLLAIECYKSGERFNIQGESSRIKLMMQLLFGKKYEDVQSD